MDKRVENQLKTFYQEGGWQTNREGVTLDALLWEDLRPCAAVYVSACRRRVLKHLPTTGDKLLDAASGPLQYPEYLEYSENFSSRYCVDISEKALTEAQAKLGAKGKVFCASLLALPFSDNQFDATVSLHTVYHIEASQQETAVRELLRVTKPGKTVVIVYSNPNKFLTRLKHVFGMTKNVCDKVYFYAHPLEWWKSFSDLAKVEIHPWRTLTAQDAQRLIPGGIVGKAILKIIYILEEWFPNLAAKGGAYPMIVLKKL